MRSSVLFVVALLAGCRSAPTEPALASGEPAPPIAAQPGPPAVVRVFGESVEGRPLEVYTLGSGERTLLLMASIHGDEAAGTPLLEELLERWRARPDLLRRLRVVVAPDVNPDGVTKGRRRNANGVDINRNFPAENYVGGRGHGTSPLSQPESLALAELFDDVAPDLIVSIHQPVGVVDWDGPAEQAAQALGDAIDLPARRMGSRPGSMGSYLGVDRGMPVITLELPSSAARLDTDALWERYGPGFEAVAATLR